MSILIKKDIFKISIRKKEGIIMMSLISLIILIMIISNISWLKNYNVNEISNILKNKGRKVTITNADSYVRFRVIISIVGNTLVSGLFSGIIWWSFSKGKRLGLPFGFFWIIIFIGNAISTPFYSIKLDYLSVIIGILNGLLAILIFFWTSSLISYRQRLKQEIARKRFSNE